MTPDIRLDEAGALCALRKAAVLVHWIPGLGVMVRQQDRPDLRVATFPGDEFFSGLAWDPCSFRRLVHAHMTSAAVGMPGVLDLERGLTLDLFTGEGTHVDDQGLVLHHLDAETSVIAFASLTTVTQCETVGVERGASSERPTIPSVRVDFSEDLDLGVVMAHASVDRRDREALESTHAMMTDLLAAYGAVEVADQFERIIGAAG